MQEWKLIFVYTISSKIMVSEDGAKVKTSWQDLDSDKTFETPAEELDSRDDAIDATETLSRRDDVESVEIVFSQSDD
jgi:hypothetical protein